MTTRALSSASGSPSASLPSSTTGPRSYTDTEAVTLGRVRRCLTVMVPLISAPNRHAAIESVAAIAADPREAECCMFLLIGGYGGSSTANPKLFRDFIASAEHSKPRPSDKQGRHARQELRRV